MAGQDTNRQSWRQKVEEVQNPNKRKNPYQFDWQTGIALDKMNWQTALGYALGRALNRFLIAPAIDRWEQRESDNSDTTKTTTTPKTPGNREITLPPDTPEQSGQGGLFGVNFGKDPGLGGYTPPKLTLGENPFQAPLNPAATDIGASPEMQHYFNLADKMNAANQFGSAYGNTPTSWEEKLSGALSGGKDFSGNIDTSVPIGNGALNQEDILRLLTGGR